MKELTLESLKCEASESVQFSTCYEPIHRFQRVKAKSSFFSKIKIHLRKKIHSLSCLTRVYLCEKIETIWVFDPRHKNFIFVWFLHGCPLNSSCTLSCSLRLNFPRSLLIFCLVQSVSTSEARSSSASASSSSFILKEGDFVNKPIFVTADNHLKYRAICFFSWLYNFILSPVCCWYFLLI